MVDVGETWRCLFTKCVLRVTGPKDTNGCQDDQLCVGLKAGIDGVVYGVQYIWGANSSIEDWVLLMVDAKKAFSEIDLIGMFWTGQHLWPSEDRFV